MNCRELSETTPRVETGAVRFGKDWPGVFIRGDDAFGYADSLSFIIKHVEQTVPVGTGLPAPARVATLVLKGLLQLFESSQVGGPT